MLKPALTVAADAVIAATLLPFIHKGYWWLRVFDFPRIQIAALGALVGAAIAAHDRRARRSSPWLMAGLAGSVGYQCLKILPYTRLYPRQSLRPDRRRPGAPVRLLAANVKQDNRNAEALLDIVRQANADVVCLVETDEWWARSVCSLDERYPYNLKCPLDNTYGMLLYSRFPLESPEILFRVQSDIPSMRAKLRLPGCPPIQLHCLHPRPPRPYTEAYVREAELVLVAREAAEHPGPTIVLGDLNDVGWSFTTTLFQKLSGLLDPRVGRGMFNTFHADIPLLRYPLDHLFHSADFGVVSIARLPGFGSDHFPLFCALSFDPGLVQHHDTPEADEDDHEKADEFVEKGVDA